MTYDDPLTVVNAKRECPDCGRVKPEIKSCKTCDKHGFLPANISGIWAPSPGFLLCGGPSSNKLPLEKLRERGIVSLGINNSAGHIYTNAWIFSDPQEKFHHGLYVDPKIMTFAPIPKLDKRVRVKVGDEFIWSSTKVMDCPNTYGFDRKTSLYPDKFLKTTYAQWGYGGKQPEDTPFECLATMLLGIRMMCYLGCPRIYLLGVDFFRGEDAQYSFNQKARTSNKRYVHETAMLKSIKPYLKESGIEVFNCNPDTKCDAFDIVSFEDAFEDCKGLTPAEPFDLANWYDKPPKK